MSQFSIEALVRSAAGDGGSAAMDFKPPRVDSDDLIRAWSEERSRSIECEMLLNLSRTVLARLMDRDMDQSIGELQETRNLILAIDQQLRSCSTERS